MKKIWALPLLAVGLLLLIMTATVQSELYWRDVTSNPRPQDPIRALMGLPSLAIGTTSSATRNPILETFCTSLYDSPGGYCYVVAASFVETPLKDPQVFSSIPGFNYTLGRP